MFTRTRITEPNGLECASYSVSLEKEYTVEEFISEMLNHYIDEHGRITVLKPFPHVNKPNGEAHCTYIKQSADMDKIPTDILNTKIEKVTANGGWGCMNYDIVLKKKEIFDKPVQTNDGKTQIYEIPVRFSGRIKYRIEAASEEEAKAIANRTAEDADCGELEDIEWETKPACAVHDEN